MLIVNQLSSAADERRDGGGQSVGGRKREKSVEGEWKRIEMELQNGIEKRKGENQGTK